jgi:diaminohydroxyphosphoribosylaminopyrimidine deaminase / 5-amino-6-(5-phosphoribosylamino)uracil reductase
MPPSWTDTDKQAMARALELAETGRGKTHPNPMVGCVITDKYGAIIAEGAHLAYGEAHAEVNALGDLSRPEDAAALYVTLEPCSHTGKTPPCVEALLATHIPRIVIAATDPNPKVSGRGIAALLAAGRQVETGLFEAEALKLNEAFFWAITQNTPFVLLKHALTLDGHTATCTGDSQWITNASARRFAHELRASSDAILSTAQTVLADNSRLTVREVPLKGQAPKRIVLDRQARLWPEHPLFSQSQKQEQDSEIILITQSSQVTTLRSRFEHVTHVSILEGPLQNNHRFNLKALLQDLSQMAGSKGITQLMIEAGGQLAGNLLAQGLVNKLWLLYGDLILADPTAQTAFSGPVKDRLLDGHRLELSQCLFLDGNVAIEAYPISSG